MYYILEPEVAGGFGENVVYDPATRHVEHLHYQFDGWLGDDLLDRFGLAPSGVAAGDGHKRLHAVKQSILATAREQLEPGGEPRRSVDNAITGLIEALDRPGELLAQLEPPAAVN